MSTKGKTTRQEVEIMHPVKENNVSLETLVADPKKKAEMKDIVMKAAEHNIGKPEQREKPKRQYLNVDELEIDTYYGQPLSGLPVIIDTITPKEAQGVKWIDVVAIRYNPTTGLDNEVNIYDGMLTPM